MKNNLSIVIPIYNAEKYIRQCIESILCSTLKDYELLLVDDGSTDDSGRICDEYAEKDERIRVFHQENGGVSKARNVGIDNAQAPWITFIDADDWISDTFLGNLYKTIEEHPDVDFVQAGCTNYRNGQIQDVEQHYDFYIGEDKKKLFDEFRGLAISKLYKKEILSKYAEVRYDVELTSLEDFLFTLDYILYVGSYVFVSEKGYYYRRDNEGSATNIINNISYASALHLYKHMERGMMAYTQKYNIYKLPRHRREALAKYMWLAICLLYHEDYTRKDRLSYLSTFDFEEKKHLIFVEGIRNKMVCCTLTYLPHPWLFDILMRKRIL